MEVNVDLLDQMELIDISDQEALDVFFSSSGEEGGLTSPLPGRKTWDDETAKAVHTPATNRVLRLRPTVQGHNKSEDVISHGLFRHVLEGLEAKSRMSSTSSNSSSDSQTPNADEGMNTGTLKRRAAPPETERPRGQTPSTAS